MAKLINYDQGAIDQLIADLGSVHERLQQNHYCHDMQEELEHLVAQVKALNRQAEQYDEERENETYINADMDEINVRIIIEKITEEAYVDHGSLVVQVCKVEEVLKDLFG